MKIFTQPDNFKKFQKKFENKTIPQPDMFKIFENNYLPSLTISKFFKQDYEQNHSPA